MSSRDCMVGQSWAKGRVVLRADELRCVWAASSILAQDVSYFKRRKTLVMFSYSRYPDALLQGQREYSDLYGSSFGLCRFNIRLWLSDTRTHTKAQTWRCKCIRKNSCTHTHISTSAWLSLWVVDLSAKQNFLAHVSNFICSPDQATKFSLCI